MYNLRIGTVSLPFAAIIAVGIYLIAYIAARVPLGSAKDERRRLTEFLSSAAIAFLIGWKASLVITDGRDIIQNPTMLLFNSGGRWNLALGMLTSVTWISFKWFRGKTAPGITRAILRFFLVGLGLGFPFAFLWPAVFFRPSENLQELQTIRLTTPEGELWTTEAAQDKTLVLNFWASWCPPCKAEMPMLADMSRDTRFSDTLFFAVNAQSSEAHPNAASQWLAENHISIPLLFDADGSAAAAKLNVTGLPTTFILNGRGQLIARRTGAVERSWIRSGIRNAEKQHNNPQMTYKDLVREADGKTRCGGGVQTTSCIGNTTTTNGAGRSGTTENSSSSWFLNRHRPDCPG